MKKFIALLLCILAVSTLSSCRKISEYNRDDEYSANVKSLVDDTVKYTRIWKEYDEKFDCHDIETAEEYIVVLEEIEKICRQLLTSTPSEKFDENDGYIKEDAGKLLSVKNKKKNHIKYAVKNADDTLFQKEKTELFSEYMEEYENLAEASQYLQTFWRNA